jgi:integration host factor subunit beta
MKGVTVGETKLTKAEIIEQIYPYVSVSKKNIHKILDLFFQEVKQGLLSDKIIELRGFGTFEVKMRKGRKARNPKTGESVIVHNHGVAVFRPGRELKQKAWTLRA